MKPVFRTNQLSRHPNLIAGALNAALEHVRHAERFRDFRDGPVLISECEARGARRDLQVGNLREHVQDGFGKAIGEIDIVRIGGHVRKRQDGYRSGIHGCHDAVGGCGRPPGATDA